MKCLSRRNLKGDFGVTTRRGVFSDADCHVSTSEVTFNSGDQYVLLEIRLTSLRVTWDRLLEVEHGSDEQCFVVVVDNQHYCFCCWGNKQAQPRFTPRHRSMYPKAPL
jgi:hypothetical protein